MRRNLRYVMPVLLLVPLTLAFAGGWAVITVEDVPEYLVAGKRTELMFTVRQHGVDPMDELAPRLQAQNGSHKLEVKARPASAPGRYYAAFELPAAGDWNLRIHSGFNSSELALLPMRTIAKGSKAPAPLSDSERGRQLFAAKGCVNCHTHARVPGSGGVRAGPDLTAPPLTADYLTRFLADPSIGRARNREAWMPDLDLDEREIRALVAFLRGGKPAN